MIEKNNLFDQLRETPMADLDIVEQLKGLMSNPKDLGPNAPSVHFTVEYFWYTSDGKDLFISLEWGPEDEFVSLYANSHDSPELVVDLFLRNGTCSYYCTDSRGKKKPIEPEEFWEKFGSILNTKAGHVAKDGVIGH